MRMRLKELAESRVRYGYRRLHILLQREGWRVNHKRVYRIYAEEGLSMNDVWGKPWCAIGSSTMASAYIEAFNARLRQECLL